MAQGLAERTIRRAADVMQFDEKLISRKVNLDKFPDANTNAVVWELP